MTLQNVADKVSIPALLLIDEATRANPEAVTAWKEENGIAADQELVELELTLGGVIFDLYVQNTPKPLSPLAVKKAEAEILALSTQLTSDSFEVSDKVKEAIKLPLSDDAVFAKTGINASFGEGENKKSMTLLAGILYNTPQILAGLTSLFPQE